MCVLIGLFDNKKRHVAISVVTIKRGNVDTAMATLPSHVDSKRGAHGFRVPKHNGMNMAPGRKPYFGLQTPWDLYDLAAVQSSDGQHAEPAVQS